jgi:NAD/NADP transhydrogenase alpha subunit
MILDSTPHLQKTGQTYTIKAGAGAKAGFCDEVYAAV